MFKHYDYVRILTVEDDEDINAEGRIVSDRNKKGEYWVTNLNMPFMGTISEFIHEDNLMLFKDYNNKKED